MIIQAAACGWLCRRRVEVIHIIARLKEITKEHKRTKRKEAAATATAAAAAAAALGPRKNRITTCTVLPGRHELEDVRSYSKLRRLRAFETYFIFT